MPTADSSKVLYGSRVRYLVSLFGALLFVILGVTLISSGKPFGWALLVFFGLGALVFAVSAAKPPRLELTAEGFRFSQLLARQELALRWTQCSEFRAAQVALKNSVITFDTERSEHQLVQSMSRALVGRNGGIMANYRGITPTQLAQLMNDYRNRALAGQPPA